MYQVLARKYRPKVFDEIIGQDTIVRTLKNAVTNNRVSHAYIFTGTRGVGKTSIARILAKSINCENGPTATPCGVCQACLQIQNGSSVDVIEIDGASNTGVDSIRDLKESIIYSPQSLRFKIYIIDEVHMLSNSAFNALLKTLEEPPAHAKFIFATTEIHKVPETILSRCQRFNFKRIPTRVIFEKLKGISASEDIVVSDENIMIIASMADGSLRDSLSILDTVISYFGRDIKEDVSSVLGLTSKTAVSELVSAMFRKDHSSMVKIAREIYDSGTDIRQFMKQTALYIRNILVIKLKYKDLVYDMTDEEINSLIPLAEEKPAEELLDMIDILINADSKYQRISLPLLMLELTMFRLVNVPSKHNVEKLIDMLGSVNIENKKKHEPVEIPTAAAKKTLPGEPGTGYGKTPDNKNLEKQDKLFDHFTKTDEKFEAFSKEKRYEAEEPSITASAEKIPSLETHEPKYETKSEAEQGEKDPDIIKEIREIFGDAIERIDKNAEKL